MLVCLTVENYALIDRLDVRFDSHLNIITGETGAGKSILMGALSLLLGAKADAESAIKDRSRNCVVEGTFALDGLGLEPIFDEQDLDYEPQTVIRRVVMPNGKSRAFVNDSPVQVATLKTIGEYLIDIHSQNRNLILTSEQFRIEALDTIAGCTAQRAEYRTAFAALGKARRALEEAIAKQSASHDDEDWLRHQVEELRAASLREGETEALESELRLLENADSIRATLLQLHSALDEEPNGILSQLKESENALRHITSYYPSAGELAERLHSVGIELKDINSTVEEDAERSNADPDRTEQITLRLDLLYALCVKHRVADVSALISLRDRYSAELDAIEHGDEQVESLRREVAECEKRARTLADALHKARAEAAPRIDAEVVGTLRKVGMEGAAFRTAISEVALGATGGDSVAFLFSANAQIEPRPIERIASGGELSRVMLALKAILARRLSLPTIVFDEIDTGVSGRVADAVGDIINTLSEQMQVIDITHLPQVAAKGNTHLLVYKEQGATHLRPLSTEERIIEIAKMLSGSTVTEAALTQARNLLGK